MQQELIDELEQYITAKNVHEQRAREAKERELQQIVDSNLLCQKLKAAITLPALNEMVAFLNSKEGYEIYIVDDYTESEDTEYNTSPVSIFVSPKETPKHQSAYMTVSFSTDKKNMRFATKHKGGKENVQEILLDKVNVDLIQKIFVSFFTYDRPR